MAQFTVRVLDVLKRTVLDRDAISPRGSANQGDANKQHRDSKNSRTHQSLPSTISAAALIARLMTQLLEHVRRQLAIRNPHILRRLFL